MLPYIKMFNLLKKNKPNVILILIDGSRYDVVNSIPFYQELRKEATFFSQVITYAPYTIGSLHALFSGMYGNRNGVNGYYNSYSFDKENCTTLTQYMKSHGYYTECDLIKADVKPHQGFDKTRAPDEFRDNLIERHSEILTQIKDRQPFFLFLDYSKIHRNLVANVIKKYSDFDKEYFDNKEKNLKTYTEWVEESGHYLKAILSKIKELGLWDNSIVLIFNDHGASVGDKIGEKAYGVYLYDYTIRCYLYIIGKYFPKNVVIRKLVRSIDILPTLLEFFKIKEKDGYKKIQGKSFLPFLHGKEEERIAYSETGGLGGPTPSPELHNVQCVRTNKWKLIYNKTSKQKELYNIEEDKEEKTNLAGKELDVEKKLWEEMLKEGKN